MGTLRPHGRALACACAALLLATATGCPRKGDDGHTPPEDARATPEQPPAPLPPLEPLPLGLSSLADYAYNRDTEGEAFQRGLRAAESGEWQSAAREASAVLATAPTHLEAAWMLALARIQLGDFAGAQEPLSTAVAGDWLRWGKLSLEDPRLAGFHASAEGARYRELAASYEERFAEALRRGLLVVGRRGLPWHPERTGTVLVNHRSELYAFAPDSGRYVRASRTNGGLIGYARVAGDQRVLYASYQRVSTPAEGAPWFPELRVGAIDLGRGEMATEIAFSDVQELELGFLEMVEDPAAGSEAPGAPGSVSDSAAGSAPGSVPGATAGDQPGVLVPSVRLRTRDGEEQRATLDFATGTAQPVVSDGPLRGALAVTGDAIALARLPVPGVLADWDDAGTAGAFRLERTRRTVTLPAGESAAGNSMSWSPSGVRLAVATAPAERCGDEQARRVTLYVVDAATGALGAVATGAGAFAPVWLSDERLAYMQGEDTASAVVIRDVVADATVAQLETPGGVATQHLPRLRCPPPPASPADAGPGGPAHRDGAADAGAATGAASEPPADAGAPVKTP
ncbi:hypothetical protein [Haliangium ochraceum]|uniref:Lipoprotein n=1 Tax=Haliangium ochraceum (strain DSM 14365 / JCM 11303 / SMP-2) TaxID=502025 RepID=D0LK05_HALO1|nr:hypothetical protein [Haliangium ochraceum]ACY18512.1 hypothetical protein Hoch_6037 [Haliangium ochraceum DSM 14365]